MEADINTTIRLRPLVRDVSDARRFVGSRLKGWGMPGAVDIAILLTSEVVTNAVVHAGPHSEEDEVVIGVDRSVGRVRVEVTDGHQGTPVRGDGAVDRESGRGLLLLDALSSAWGVTRCDAGKVVWFEVDASPVP